MKNGGGEENDWTDLVRINPSSHLGQECFGIFSPDIKVSF
jgi:hypothetical protein